MPGLVPFSDRETKVTSASEIEECRQTVNTLTACIDQSNDALDNLEDSIDRATKAHGVYRIKIDRIKGKLRKLSNDL